MIRERWNRADWIGTLALCVLFPPIGIAALGRWAFGQYVWYADHEPQSIASRASTPETPEAETWSDLTQCELAATWLYGEEYAMRGVSAIDFWRQLPPVSKKIVRDMVRDLMAARPTPPERTTPDA